MTSAEREVERSIGRVDRLPVSSSEPDVRITARDTGLGRLLPRPVEDSRPVVLASRVLISSESRLRSEPGGRLS